ncbi:hypothetical protein GUJ93_ZPchr0013g35349 [Zizania palustris]|uniref:Uncharacterized protein n=1 Tax=Zizania palustris TaxID=103762 RepID=A0A8J5WYW1_ZIZPA|nr:hypothetical protein GUJ93_ZPchr0013g35349 [Zizania palustris]
MLSFSNFSFLFNFIHVIMFNLQDPVSGASLPAELAKQYMNSRYSREPQKNSLRSRVLIKNKADASNITYDTNRSGGPLVQEPNQFGNENSELTLNGHVTPGLRGRSAIYRMSRSPFFKGPSSSNDVNMSPFSQSQARAHSLVSGGRQVLKRRGTDLDDELASIGPIRRIRQKSIMVSTFRDSRVSPQGNFLPNRTIGSDLTDGSSPIQCPSSKRPLLGTGQSVQPAEEDRNVEDGKSAKSSSDNVLAVSPQSNKMADKIFEQLNIIVPSPKKQSCAQSVNGNVSCSTLKQPVWQDNEPNSASDPTSSQKFQYMDRVNHSLDPELNGSPFSNAKLRKDGSSKLSGSFQDFGNKDIKSDNVAMSNKPAILENSVSATISGKPGFKMAVFEDLSEFDDDQEPPVQSKYSAGKTGVKRTDNKFDLKIKEQKVESNLVEKVVSAPVSEKPIASPPKDVLCLGLFSPNDAEKRANPDVPSYNNIGLRFPHIPHDTHPKSTEPEVSLASNKDNKLTSASAFTFGLKQSSASGSEPSNTAGVKTETGLGESVTKPTTLDSNLGRGNERGRAENVDKSSGKVLPSAASTLAAPFHFASAASTSILSNGFSNPSSSNLSNITPTDKPVVSLAPATIPTTFAQSSSSPHISSPIPAIGTFNFGSSKASSTEEAKSTAQDMANKASPNLSTTSMPSNISISPVTSSSFSSTATFSSSAVASSNALTASTTPFTFSSSGNSIFGFNSTTQSAGLSTSVGGSTAQQSAASMMFGSKLPQSVGTVSQTPNSSSIQFSSSFPTVTTAAGASSSGSEIVSSGVITASTGSGTMSFGIGTSSSGTSTMSFGLGAPLSGTGALSFGELPHLELGLCLLEQELPHLELGLCLLEQALPHLELGLCLLEQGLPHLELGLCLLEQGLPHLELGLCLLERELPHLVLELCLLGQDPPHLDLELCLLE